MKCEACGHNTRKGRRNYERRDLAKKLCNIMGWSDDDIWSVQNTAMGCRRLEDLINRLENKRTTKYYVGELLN